MENTSDSFMPRPLLFCLKSGRSVCYSVPDNSYTEHYSLGDIFIYTSADEEKGVLLELKGRGCRQFESYLLAPAKKLV